MVSGVGMKNTINVLLVSDMCEVVIEYSFTMANYENVIIANNFFFCRTNALISA